MTGGSLEPLERDLYKVLATDLPHARRLAFGVVLGQAGVTVAAALCAWGIADRRAALSALLGGGIATAGSLAMARLVFGGGAGADARRALGALYLGEALKLAVVIALFVLVLKWVRVAPLAMLAAFAATLLVYRLRCWPRRRPRGGACRGAWGDGSTDDKHGSREGPGRNAVHPAPPGVPVEQGAARDHRLLGHQLRHRVLLGVARAGVLRAVPVGGTQGD